MTLFQFMFFVYHSLNLTKIYTNAFVSDSLFLFFTFEALDCFTWSSVLPPLYQILYFLLKLLNASSDQAFYGLYIRSFILCPCFLLKLLTASSDQACYCLFISLYFLLKLLNASSDQACYGLYIRSFIFSPFSFWSSWMLHLIKHVTAFISDSFFIFLFPFEAPECFIWSSVLRPLYQILFFWFSNFLLKLLNASSDQACYGLYIRSFLVSPFYLLKLLNASSDQACYSLYIRFPF